MQKRILVLKTADSRYFEEAHLILKENPAEQAEDDSMVAEANRILQNARNSRGWMGKISLLFLVAAVCCMGLSSLYFVALWGAYATIAAALHQKIMQKMKDQNEK